jgi:peptide-methionine (S)-S-oxide reductase
MLLSFPAMNMLRLHISRPVLVGLCIGSLAVSAIAYGAITNGTNPFGKAVEPKYHLAYAAVNLANPTIDLPKSDVRKSQTLILAGGCFWGVEGVFEKLKGVSNVVSGYSGGNAATANYDVVSSGRSGHAEAVQITYDPEQISYGQLLKVFFAIAHDPTQRDRQGNDIGKQYRSAIFFANDDEKRVAQSYIAQLDQSQVFAKPIATQLTALDRFYAAEKYHQDFMQHNPRYPYVVVHDLPKIERLVQQFPTWIKS